MVGYVENVGTLTIGEIKLAVLVGHLIQTSLMYGYAHVVKSLTGKTRIAPDAVVNTKNRYSNSSVFNLIILRKASENSQYL